MLARPLPSDTLLRPLPPLLLVPVAALVLAAGASYCLGYEGLIGGIGHWPSSFLWSAYAVLPWLALFEAVKRRERGTGAPLPLPMLIIGLLATGAVSILAESAADWIRSATAAPLALQLMRRMPAIAATLLLLLLARRSHIVAKADRVPGSDCQALLRHAPALVWIRAADNYLELHLDRRIVTLRLTMRQAAALLEPLGFARIHRSVIVARRRIAVVGRERVRMDDGSELPLGRAFAAKLMPKA